MKFIKKIDEVWNGEALDWNRIDDDGISYYYFNSYDIEYKVEIENVDDSYLIYHFKFFRKYNGVWTTDKFNGEKNTNKFISLSTIGSIFKDFFSNRNYDCIIYSSLINDKSRLKLYNSVSALIISNFGGYFFNDDSRNVKYYVHYFSSELKDYLISNYKDYIIKD